MNRIFKILSSLRLTVILLSLAAVLVVIGTLAQVKLGLWEAQSEYFRSLFIYWSPAGSSSRIPVFPGGWLLGGLLLINLIAAHAQRFQLSKKKIGIFLIHAGLILLLLGQFFTEVFQVESNIRFEEGETRNYSEDSRETELVFIDKSGEATDRVVSIPEDLFAQGGEITLPEFPLVVRVKKYFANSQQAGPVSPGEKMSAKTPDGQTFWFSSLPITSVMDMRNVPSVLFELATTSGDVIGERVASLWIDGPQTIEAGGRAYQFALRPTRYYTPFSLTLLDFRHDLYQGTEKPKNFSSRIKLVEPGKGDTREVLIRMNEPLRHAGLTYFQASFDPRNDKVTILQVVRNPAALTPYISCTLMSAGLLVQFLSHLISFSRRQRNKAENTPSRNKRKAAVPTTAETEAA